MGRHTLCDILHLVKPIPRIDPRIVAIGKNELHGVVADELHVRNRYVRRYRVDIESADAGHLVDAAGAGACAPKLLYAEAQRLSIAPGHFEYPVSRF